MNPSDIIVQTVWEDGDATELARIQINGADMVQADLSSIQRKIFDVSSDTKGTALETTNPSIGSVVFDTLQTDGRWSKDNTGYNFRDKVAAASLDTGGRTYRVEYLFTGTGGEKFFVVWEHPLKGVHTS